MARITRQALLNLIDSDADAEAAVRQALTILASAQNPDGSAFTLPIVGPADGPLEIRVRDNDSGRMAEVNQDSALRVAQYNAEWTEGVTATAAAATATRAAPGAGTSLYVTSISASYGAAQVGTLTIDFGGGVRTFHVHNQRDVAFAAPFKVTAATAVSATLSAGAVGVVGAVVLGGYTGS